MGGGGAVKARAEQPHACVRARLKTEVTPARVTVVGAGSRRGVDGSLGARILARQTLGPAALEVLVFDGGSVDATKDVCRAFASRYPWGRFEVLDNPHRTVPHALNMGLAESRCEWFAVIAGRTTFSPDYIEACLRELETPGPALRSAAGSSPRPRGPSRARSRQSSRTRSASGRGFRTESSEGDVPHHPFAMWRRDDVHPLRRLSMRRSTATRTTSSACARSAGRADPAARRSRDPVPAARALPRVGGSVLPVRALEVGGRPALPALPDAVARAAAAATGAFAGSRWRSRRRAGRDVPLVACRRLRAWPARRSPRSAARAGCLTGAALAPRASAVRRAA